MVGVALLVFCLVAWFCVLLLCVSAWWNRGILDEVTKASYGRAVTGTAVMARSANEEKKKKASNMLPLLVMEGAGFTPDRSGLKAYQGNSGCSFMERPIKKLTSLEHIMSLLDHFANHSPYLPSAR